MRRLKLLFAGFVMCGLAMGCRNPLLTPYANLVDDINDTHIYFDRWYCPRLDVSRAGKPDWCGPVNSHMYPGVCYLGSWSRHDDDNLYPPANPYTFPSNVMPPPRVRTAPKQEDVPEMPAVPPEPSATTPD